MSDDRFTYDETCFDSEWRCGNGRCIDARKRCDGYNDCKDDEEELWLVSSDEANCESFNAQPDSDQSSSDVVRMVICVTIGFVCIFIILILCYIRRKSKGCGTPAGETQMSSAQGTHQNNPPSASPTQCSPAFLNTSASAPAHGQQQNSLPREQFDPPSYNSLLPHGNQNRAAGISYPPPSYEDVMGLT